MEEEAARFYDFAAAAEAVLAPDSENVCSIGERETRRERGMLYMMSASRKSATGLQPQESYTL